MSTPLIPIICSTRESASRGVLAWTVVIEPSWPVFIACSMSNASPPRTSPTMIRSGRMRSAVLDQVALDDLALALDIGRARFEPGDMGLLQLKLGRILDRHDPLAIVDERRHGVEHGRLARAGAARDQHVEPRRDDRLQHFRDLRRDRADLDQAGHADRGLGELADRQQRAVERQRRNHRVDAAAVGQARVDHRRGFIDPAADRGDDLLDDPNEVLLVLEPHGRRLEHAVTARRTRCHAR